VPGAAGHRRDEWSRVERGLVQRLQALEMFLAESTESSVSSPSRSSRRSWSISRATSFPRCAELPRPGGVRIHIAGIDPDPRSRGRDALLEDNLRVPLGCSHTCSRNRVVTKRVFQHAMERAGVRRIDEYPTQLAAALRSVAPGDPEEATSSC